MPQESPDPFAPTRGLAFLAAGAAAAVFFLPQEAPLEFYPLNHDSPHTLYLEIVCAANVDSNVQIFYDVGRGVNNLHSYFWPIGPSERTYTYTFPLPDAPIRYLRIDPLEGPGELRVRDLRIINRREKEIRRFTRDMFVPYQQIEAIEPTEDGWKFVTTEDANDPHARIELFSPVIPEGMNIRNLQRCLLSTGYLALMLWILLLAVYFTLLRHRDWKIMGRSILFLALVAALFSTVGNRRLIRDSIQYARFKAPAIEPGLRLEFDLAVGSPGVTQLFWDTGQGFNEEESLRLDHKKHILRQTVRFPLPGQPVHNLRFDPLEDEGTITLFGVRVVNQGQQTRRLLPFNSLIPKRQIESFEEVNGRAIIQTTPDADDPILEFRPDEVSEIRRLIEADLERR